MPVSDQRSTNVCSSYVIEQEKVAEHFLPNALAAWALGTGHLGNSLSIALTTLIRIHAMT